MSETTPLGGPPAPAEPPDKAPAPVLSAAPPAEPDKASQLALEEAMARLRGDQNLGLAIAGGAAAALAGAIAWAAITAAIERRYGIMAIGIGFLVGFAVRFLGKGVDTTFRVVGAALAFLGCFMGNAFALCYLETSGTQFSFWSVLGTPSVVFEIMKVRFGFMDVVFYAIAAYCGWRFALRQLSEEDVKRLAGEAPKQP